MKGRSRLYSYTRNFLFFALNKEFLIFLFFLLVSASFWLMMALNETNEKELKVCVVMTNVPQNVIVTDSLPDTITVTVRDNGYVLATYLYGERLSPLHVNFASYANKSAGHGTVPIADIQRMIYQQLSESSKIVSVKPDRFSFYFNYGTSKRLPVRIFGEVKPERNYYLARYKFSPDYVTVYASKKVLDSLTAISTERLHIVNFNDTVRQRVRLRDMKGCKVVPETVMLTLYADVMTEESIEVPIVAVNMPEGKILRTFPSKVRINFVVGASAYRRMRPEAFRIVADYKELIAHPSDKCNLYIESMPQDVRNVRLEVNKVDYLIEEK